MNTSCSITYDRTWTWITFPEKPAESILAALRTFARFSNRRCAWYVTERLAETEIAERLNVSQETVIEVAPETAPILETVFKADPANIAAKVCIERNRKAIEKARKG